MTRAELHLLVSQVALAPPGSLHLIVLVPLLIYVRILIIKLIFYDFLVAAAYLLLSFLKIVTYGVYYR
jgi:hypothetical protein